jgi:hypothetical protein
MAAASSSSVAVLEARGQHVRGAAQLQRGVHFPGQEVVAQLGSDFVRSAADGAFRATGQATGFCQRRVFSYWKIRREVPQSHLPRWVTPGVAVGAVGFLAQQRFADGCIGVDADGGFTGVDVALAAGAHLELQHLLGRQVPAQQALMSRFFTPSRPAGHGVGGGGSAVEVGLSASLLAMLPYRRNDRLSASGPDRQADALGAAFLGVFGHLPYR